MIYKFNDGKSFEADEFVCERFRDLDRYLKWNNSKKDLFCAYDALLKRYVTVQQVATGTESMGGAYERIFTNTPIPDFRLSNLKKTKKAVHRIEKSRIDKKTAAHYAGSAFPVDWGETDQKEAAKKIILEKIKIHELGIQEHEKTIQQLKEKLVYPTAYQKMTLKIPRNCNSKK